MRGDQSSRNLMHDFASVLSNLQSIRELEIALPRDSDCAESVVDACSHFSGLSSLTIVTPERIHPWQRIVHIEVGAAAALGSLTALRTLDLSQCPVHDDRAAHALAASLECLPQLRLLRLPTQDASDAVFHALSSCRCITSVDASVRLQRNVTGPSVERSQWASVCAQSTLQDLTLRGSQVFREQHIVDGETAASSGVGSLPCLTRLCLSGDFSQNDVSGVSSLTRLRILRVECSGLDDQAM